MKKETRKNNSKIIIQTHSERRKKLKRKQNIPTKKQTKNKHKKRERKQAKPRRRLPARPSWPPRRTGSKATQSSVLSGDISSSITNKLSEIKSREGEPFLGENEQWLPLRRPCCTVYEDVVVLIVFCFSCLFTFFPIGFVFMNLDFV